MRFDCNGFFRPVLRISFSLLEFILSSLCIYPTSYPNPMRQTAARYYLALPFAVSCPGPPPCAPCSSLPAAKSPRCSFLQCIRSRTKTFRPTRSFSRTPSPSFSSPRRRSTAPPSRSPPLATKCVFLAVCIPVLLSLRGLGALLPLHPHAEQSAGRSPPPPRSQRVPTPYRRRAGASTHRWPLEP